MSTIGPKDLEDFTDDEVHAIDESEGTYRVMVAPGGGLTAFRDGPAVRDLPVVDVNYPIVTTHRIVPDPED